MQTEDYIGVFDSGVGGLSVLRHLQRVLPREQFVYFGDCANAPYGNRSTEEVRALTLAAAEQLISGYPLKALVVACNTATAAAIGALRKKYPDLIVIGIEPALKLAADAFPGGCIGVMATQVTLREEKFDVLLHRFDTGCTVTKIPAPGLVELIEAGKAEAAETEARLRVILSPYIGKLDALVLGCTHYPFAAGAISRVLGEKWPSWMAVTVPPGRPGADCKTLPCCASRAMASCSSPPVAMRNGLCKWQKHYYDELLFMLISAEGAYLPLRGRWQ